MADKLEAALLREVHRRTVKAVEQAIRDSFGNLHMEPAWFEEYITASISRVGILARHDTELYLARVKQYAPKTSIGW